MCTLETVQGPLRQPLAQGREPALQVKPDLMWKWEGRTAGRKALESEENNPEGAEQDFSCSVVSMQLGGGGGFPLASCASPATCQ